MVQQIKFTIPAWPVEQMTGYKPFTTFWQDFSIADRFGVNGIKSTFTRAFRELKLRHKPSITIFAVLNVDMFKAFIKRERRLPMATNKSLCATCRHGSRYGSSYFCAYRCKVQQNNKYKCEIYIKSEKING